MNRQKHFFRPVSGKIQKISSLSQRTDTLTREKAEQQLSTHLPYPIRKSTPEMPKRVYDFLIVEVKDEHALQALQEVQASVRVRLKNALRIH